MPLPHNIHAPTSITKPEPVGLCDSCCFLYPLRQLLFQTAWRGNAIINTNLRKCPRCIDALNEQDRPILIGPDPKPLKDPRPGWWAQQQQGGPPIPNPQSLIED
jgi:hypothetical protein